MTRRTPGRRDARGTDRHPAYRGDEPGWVLPFGVTQTNGVYNVTPAVRIGVFQALSSRNGGEVISADAF